MSIFEGVATALITPFGPDGSVNYAKLEELINKQIEDGVDGLVICGTTGESATLTEKEHMDVIRESVKFVNGRVPVIQTAHRQLLRCQRKPKNTVRMGCSLYPLIIIRLRQRECMSILRILPMRLIYR